MTQPMLASCPRRILAVTERDESLSADISHFGRKTSAIGLARLQWVLPA
ncbi:MAG: hypothetical protein IPG34_18000 [Rhodocyclaceae bacterium]|nr:hypothetical protein [Rhodocyclaceae bacterium]